MAAITMLELFLTLRDAIEDEVENPDLRSIVKEAVEEGKDALLALPHELGYELVDGPIPLSEEDLEAVSGGVRYSGNLTVEQVLQQIINRLQTQKA